MTEEEMRAKIVELETTLETNKNTIDALNSQLTTEKKSTETLQTTVATLKQQNYDLFMKVPQTTTTEVKKEETKPDVKSIDDLTNILLGVE